MLIDRTTERWYIPVKVIQINILTERGATLTGTKPEQKNGNYADNHKFWNTVRGRVGDTEN